MNASDHSSDVIVVGMGIIGLAHALAAAKLGKSVRIIDRQPHSVGASVRNFGFVTITGQERGDFWSLALRARDIWTDVAEAAQIPILHRGLAMVARRQEASRSDTECDPIKITNYFCSERHFLTIEMP